MARGIDTIKRVLLRAGLSEIDFRQIQRSAEESNRNNLIVLTAFASAFLAGMFLLSYLIEAIAAFKGIYGFFMLIVLLLFAVARFYALGHPRVLLCGIYIFIGCLFAFGIVLGTVATPDELSVTFIALLLTVPLLFTDRPIRMIGMIYLSVLVFTLAAYRTKQTEVFWVDVIDAFVFGIISAITSSYMMRVKYQKHLYEWKAIFLSKTDLLTGLRNRNAYEQSLVGYPALCRKGLCCIYVDVNGLHELNNTKGHQAGDEMLQYIAKSLLDTFGQEHTYRIGGDEFVVFAVDWSAAALEKTMKDVLRRVEQAGYHIAIGMETQTAPDISMDRLIKNAEKKMYEAKYRYYQENGTERCISAHLGAEESMEEAYGN